MRSIKVCLNEHRSSIKLYQSKVSGENVGGETMVARHFAEHKHRVSKLKWMILEKIEDERQIKGKLLRREVYWISTLGQHE